jgi:hypothetical protein
LNVEGCSKIDSEYIKQFYPNIKFERRIPNNKLAIEDRYYESL